MSFQDAVRTCLQQKYADFSGRARRSEYWFFYLFYGIVITLLEVLLLIFANVSSLLEGLVWLLIAVAALGGIVPGLAVTVRRLHDTSRSGWWYFIGFVPLVGGIILFVFTVLDSTPGPNQYGPNPKGIEPSYGYGVVPPPAPSQS